MIDQSVIQHFREQLDGHPVYSRMSTVEDLRCFMEHHVYSVWDFMSLIKYLQSAIAPSSWPWAPVGDPAVRRFINELVMEEESDGDDGGRFFSHFELYQEAMREVGADPSVATQFVETAMHGGIQAALALPQVPGPAREFTATTFDFIARGRPHEVAAALALGREHIIPQVFRSILSRMSVSAHEAPLFHFYLNRHVELDEDFHAPLSLRLLNQLCEGDASKIEQAVAAARHAVSQRLRFWDGVGEAITQRRHNATQ